MVAYYLLLQYLGADFFHFYKIVNLGQPVGEDALLRFVNGLAKILVLFNEIVQQVPFDFDDFGWFRRLVDTFVVPALLCVNVINANYTAPPQYVHTNMQLLLVRYHNINNALNNKYLLFTPLSVLEQSLSRVTVANVGAVVEFLEYFLIDLSEILYSLLADFYEPFSLIVKGVIHNAIKH